MDPNAVYKAWWSALLEENVELARQAHLDLYEWLAKGGFEPDCWEPRHRKQFFSFDPETGRLS